MNRAKACLDYVVARKDAQSETKYEFIKFRKTSTQYHAQ